MTINEAIENYKRIADAYEKVGSSKDAEETAQIAEWLRRARGADEAAKWFTAKIREIEDENQKLRKLVDAWMGCGTRYHTMKGGCPMFDENAKDFCKAEEMARKLGIEVR